MEWYDRCKRYYRFSLREIKEILFSAIIFGFILTFRMWGGTKVNINEGLSNWLLGFIFVFLTIFWSISWAKIFALLNGLRLHYYLWFRGTILGLFLTFVTYGYIPFLYPNNIRYEHMKGLRLGRFRHGINTVDMSISSIAGVVSSIVLAMLFSFVYVKTKNYWVLFFIKTNLLFAFFALLPLPKIEGITMSPGSTFGFYIFFHGRALYVLILAVLLIYSLLIFLASSVFMSFMFFLLSVIVGLIIMFLSLKILFKIV